MTRILIVDDDVDIRDLAQLVLEQAGHEVRSAENGEVALETARSFAPELILLDMRMPGIDGWAFMTKYRGTPEPHARVIVVTAARDALAWASQVRADGYLAKPFDLRELIDAVDAALPRRPGADP